MSGLTASVIIPTYNRPEKLLHTVQCFRKQSLSPDEYEIIVVDDASEPPARLPSFGDGPACRVIRLDEMLERSVARNAGVEQARGEFVLFCDDDMGLESDFLAHHLSAHAEWPGALVVGKIILPAEALHHPGVRFRQKLELTGIPTLRGRVTRPNFCTAANMSVRRDWYLRLGGFAPDLYATEDQDFALRHTVLGGTIVFVPEAVAVHRDDWLDFPSFCRRQEFATERTVALWRKHPDLPDGHERDRKNGPVRWGREPSAESLRKLVKSILARPPAVRVLFSLLSVMERRVPESLLLDRTYRLALGVHVFRGYRSGVRKHPPLPDLVGNDGGVTPGPRAGIHGVAPR